MKISEEREGREREKRGEKEREKREEMIMHTEISREEEEKRR